jgi:hypothetical protein
MAATTAPRKKKERTRPDKKGKGSSSQPAPKKHVLERIHMPHWREIHELGEPILPAQDLASLTGDMRSLHDTVLHVEKALLRENNPSYPVFMVNVQKGFGFIDTGIGNPFLVRHADVFNMFHLGKLPHSSVCLVALGMASQLAREKTPVVAIMDPFFMLESIMSSEGEDALVEKYIEDFLVDNHDKETMLIPYFVE